MITLINQAVKYAGTISLIAKVFGLVLAFLFALMAFTVVIDAIFEVTSHIAQVYSSSDSITRLIIWIVAALFLHKAAPYFARVIRRF
jgi:hypothetical protein